MYIILAILAFGVLIIVHELGHFTLAKLNGVRVEEFSIGMGPKVFSNQGKETQYSLRLFPIGGYVKMMGEEESVEDERSFSAKSPLRRISIIIAGVFMNYVLAIVIFISFIYTNGYVKTVLSEVVPSSPAYEAGLLPGDKIERVNGSRSFTSDDASFEINMSKGNAINVYIDRNGEKKEFKVIPVKGENSQLLIGVKFLPVQNPTFEESFKQSFNQTASLVSQTFKGLEMIFTGKANLKTDVGGPLTIVKISAESAKAGIWPLLYFTAFLSVNLAVFNLLPFPALDGGWCVILLIELITRRKVPDKIVGVLNYIGFAALIGLMILVTIKDILFPVKF
ncbi:MAG: M50 family metallopeptidase [Clostridium beijerinckii]|jgi:regulator of sigma E protease|nr:M50 family metallopeptidase [Clostridium beijerinckii]MCI1577437.1 M50 family metallopeptidase [Clostridium beijerinckii]MCI1584493.1 M50 family metallopeptidase [Clostridium beijerinckii]MCI1624230.1 M50 family metallopeptidase [Clostridium beijerinckii]